jgi:hypothetical protein
VITTYLQVLAVLALVAGAALALGNETRLLIDERHQDAEFERVGRHHKVRYRWMDDACASFIRRYDTALLFAEADEAFNASAPTVYVERVTA